MVVQRFLLDRTCYTPFSVISGASARSYSLPLQRAITDFGADVSFGQVEQKLQEHYGISLPASSIQKITKGHAEQISQEFPSGLPVDAKAGSSLIIGETDGTMIPIVCFKDGQENDKRKLRTVCWKEARLSFARCHQSVQRLFAATLGSVKDAGDQLFECAQKSGMHAKTHIHCVGDGARWIREQVSRIFAHQGSYLIDFFHLSEYLSHASEKIPEEQRKEWLCKQKVRMKQNDVEAVLDDLQNHMTSSTECPIRICFRYINNCRNHLDYQGAKAKGLPIGSGEIESGHRSLIQKRLKIPGAWWLPKTAEVMLALRCARFNGTWERYWNQKYDQLDLIAA